MATHFSVLACRLPGTEEPGGLPSMGLQSRTRLKRLSSSSTYLEPKKIEPIEKESIMAVARRWEKWADAGQRVEILFIR